MRPVGILGGTFDPIHKGHTRLAREACQQLGLQQVRLIPVNIPPHRVAPVANAQDRLAMLELAIADESQLVIDDRELRQDKPSYTIGTLASLRKELGDTPLCLIMGADAFQKIDSWYCWQEIPELAHVVIAQRPGVATAWNTDINETINDHTAADAAALAAKPAGLFYFMDFPPVNISATAIRHALATNSPTDNWLHESTLNYIQENDLYRDAA